MTRLAVLLAALALALPAAAVAQQNPFGPLPPPAPTATPAPTPVPGADDDAVISTELLFGMIAGLLVIFSVIGYVITRDARRTLPKEAIAREPALRDQGPHRHERGAKAKARKKARAQRQARKKSRRR